MAMTETVTIINNSGKIISTGKHLLGLFKDAKAAYKEKKASLKPEPAVPRIQRAQTFDVTPHRGMPTGYDDYPYEDHYHDGYDPYDDRHLLQQHPQQHHVVYRQAPRPEQLDYEQRRYINDGGRRRSMDELDRRSHTSSHRSHRSRRSNRTSGTGANASERGGTPARPPLTVSNLRTLSEVSSTAPSAAPRAYRSPYAETAPRDMMLSRPTLAHAATMPVEPALGVHAPTIVSGVTNLTPPAARPAATAGAPPSDMSESTIVPTARQSMQVARPRSDPSLRKRSKSIDMHLAYGTIPPDLESRTDLDPVGTSGADGGGNEVEARTLMDRIEALLLEAQCLQHSATAIISKLQTNPDAAAAVALTLAELSALLTKMGPSFLTVIKGGAPAVFALLASPQFLIAAGATVGVTIVMFGGWKIVKRMKETQAIAAEQQQAQLVEMAPMYPQTEIPQMMPQPMAAHPHIVNGAAYPAYGAHNGTYYARPYVQQGPGSASFDEALVLEEELSTIETWRRGIAPLGAEVEGSIADMELISPEALRSTIGDDAMSRRTGRTRRSHKSHRNHRDDRGGADDDVPERKSSRGFRERDGGDDDRESRRGTSDRYGDAERRRRDRDREREREMDRESSRAGSSEAGSHRSHRSSRSKRPEARTEVRAIEAAAGDETLEVVLRPKEKKNNMLKALFKKKKDRAEGGSRASKGERSEVSVMV